MRKASFLFIFLVLYACTNKKIYLDNAFDEIYNHVALGEYDQLENHINENSISLLNEITNKDNQNIEALIKIGSKYKIKFLCVYFSGWSKHMKINGTKADFFKFLTQEKISFFNPDHIYSVLSHQTRVGTDNNFIAYHYKESNKNVMNWAKFSEQSENDFKYDLVYSLQLHEQVLKKYFNYNDRVKKELTEEEWLKSIYSGYIDMGLTPDAVEKEMENRRKRYLEIGEDE